MFQRKSLMLSMLGHKDFPLTAKCCLCVDTEPRLNRVNSRAVSSGLSRLVDSVFMFISHVGKVYIKSSDAKASKCHLKFSSLMMIFVKLVYLS